MANEKFTQLPTVVTSNLADIIAAVQGGVSSQETLQQVFNLYLANMVLNNAGNPNGLVAGVVYQLLWDTTNLVMYVCTTSGNAATAVWTVAGSVTFPMTLANGGTNKNITASNGAVVWCDANSFELTAVGVANQIFMSAGAASPVWSTATYPATTTINQLFYSSAANTVTGLASANSAMLSTGATGIPAWSASLTNGQIMIGATGGAVLPGTITAGPGISVAVGANSITISGTGSGIGWNEIVASPQAMTADTGYVANTGGLLTFTLPVTAAFGTAIDLIGKGAGGWLIAQNAGQNIQVGNVSSTVGVGGSVASTNQYDSISLICTTADTTWTVLGGPQSSGLTIV